MQIRLHFAWENSVIILVTFPTENDTTQGPKPIWFCFCMHTYKCIFYALFYSHFGMCTSKFIHTTHCTMCICFIMHNMVCMMQYAICIVHYVWMHKSLMKIKCLVLRFLFLCKMTALVYKIDYIQSINGDKCINQCMMHDHLTHEWYWWKMVTLCHIWRILVHGVSNYGQK